MKIKYTIFMILMLLYITLLYCLYSLNVCIYESNSKNWFITFGGPDKSYYNAVERLMKEIDDIQVFDHIIGYTDLDLKKDKEVWDKHSVFFENNRGYGCWIWKPYLILKTMELMEYNDVILYTDAGCDIHKNNHKKDDMVNLINRCKHYEMLFSSTNTKEKQYSKMDLIKYLNMDRDEILNSTQYQAGVLFIKKTRRTVEFVNHWYNIMCIYDLANSDSSKYNKELPDFIDSRHDQSVFSLLAKKYGFTEDNFMHEHLPINIARRRGG